MEDLSLTSHYPKKAHVHKYKISGGSQAFRSQMLQISSSTPVGWGVGWSLRKVSVGSCPLPRPETANSGPHSLKN